MSAVVPLTAGALSETVTDRPNAVHLLLVAVLVACGVYLLTDRSLTRVLLGVLLVGNGMNLLLLTIGGRAGAPPLTGTADPAEMADPLPQALILTAIVITMGVAAFVLALIHRSWVLDRRDEVLDDEADVLVGTRHPDDGEDSDDGDDGDGDDDSDRTDDGTGGTDDGARPAEPPADLALDAADGRSGLDAPGDRPRPAGGGGRPW